MESILDQSGNTFRILQMTLDKCNIYLTADFGFRNFAMTIETGLW